MVIGAVRVTGAPVRLTNLEFVEDVGVHPVVSSPESEQDGLVCSVQLVGLMWPCCCAPGSIQG